jgi:hypothetical protein
LVSALIRGGVRRTAVIRTWRRLDDDEDVQERSVFAIDGKRACTFAIDVHQAKANELALPKRRKRESRAV